MKDYGTIKNYVGDEFYGFLINYNIEELEALREMDLKEYITIVINEKMEEV